MIMQNNSECIEKMIETKTIAEISNITTFMIFGKKNGLLRLAGHFSGRKKKRYPQGGHVNVRNIGYAYF